MPLFKKQTEASQESARGIELRVRRDILRELHQAFVTGDMTAVRRVLEFSGPVTEADLAQAQKIFPWKNFWDLWFLNKMDGEICPESDVHQAAALCRERYGDSFRTSMAAVLQEWSDGPGGDGGEAAIRRHTPKLV